MFKIQIDLVLLESLFLTLLRQVLYDLVNLEGKCIDFLLQYGFVVLLSVFKILLLDLFLMLIHLLDILLAHSLIEWHI